MKIKKNIKLKDGNQVWRILISQNDKLVIETRNTEKKEVFFHCYDVISGKKIFNKYQLDEKYWVGIEEIYNDIIFFHHFAKPDMPGHKSIVAFDINTKKILWQNDEYSFLFLYDNRIYSFRQKFEAREFFTLNPFTGELNQELGLDNQQINELKYLADEQKDYSHYKFPELIDKNQLDLKVWGESLAKLISGHDLQGDIEYVETGDLLLLNFHHKVLSNILENRFVVMETGTGKKLFEEIINSSVNLYMPDSFFVYKNMLVLLKEKSEVSVYRLES